MSKRECKRCGKDPAEGLASITDELGEHFYCHNGPSPTCYELANSMWNIPTMRHPSVKTSDGIEPQDSIQGDPRFWKILMEMWQMHCEKGNDYGSDSDYLENLRAVERFGIDAWLGCLIRMNDKMVRLQNLAKGKELKNESAQDSLRDIAAYAILALILMDEKNANRV